MGRFASRVYKLLKKVPPGEVTTYKLLAKALGVKAYQAVGQALKNNPDAPRIPCHRVVKSNGRIGGFMGRIDKKSKNKKKALLEKEGIEFVGDKIRDFDKKRYSYT